MITCRIWRSALKQQVKTLFPAGMHDHLLFKDLLAAAGTPAEASDSGRALRNPTDQQVADTACKAGRRSANRSMSADLPTCHPQITRGVAVPEELTRIAETIPPSHPANLLGSIEERPSGKQTQELDCVEYVRLTSPVNPGDARERTQVDLQIEQVLEPVNL